MPPLKIIQRQTTFWDLLTGDKKIVRIHFLDKYETNFQTAQVEDWQILDENELLVDYQSKWSTVYLSKRPSDPEGVYNALKVAIASLTSRNIQKYCHGLWILEKGYGQLLEGSNPIIDACRIVLEELDVAYSVLDSRKRMLSAKVLRLGNNYVIARDFRVEYLAQEHKSVFPLVTCIHRTESYALSYGCKYEMEQGNLEKEQIQVRGDNGRLRWYPTSCFDLSGKDALTIQSIWYESETWVEGQLNSSDGNTDVIVTLSDDTRWATTVFTVQNLQTLFDKNKVSGEFLSGTYFWSRYMLIVEEINPTIIEKTIQELLENNEFSRAFEKFIE